MRLRISPFICGVVFAISLTRLLDAVLFETWQTAAIAALVAVLAIGIGVRVERLAEAEAFELTEYRQDKLAYERRVAGITADVDREAARLSLN